MTPDTQARKRRRWRWLVGAIVVAPLLFLVRPGLHLWRTGTLDVDQLEAVPAGYADDASRMNRTAVREVRSVSANRVAAEQQLAALLAEAREKGWRVSIAGARHSMGGHTIYPDGVVLDMLPLMEWNSTRRPTRSTLGQGPCGATSFDISTRGTDRSLSCSRTIRSRWADRSV